MEDITILEEPAVQAGIVEVEAPTAKPAPVQQEEVLFSGRKVYALPGYFYCEGIDLPYSTYHYGQLNYNDGLLAATYMYGETPVFADSLRSMEMFHELCERATITVAPGKSIFFLRETSRNVYRLPEAGIVVAYDGVTAQTFSDHNETTLRFPGPIMPSDAIFTGIKKFISRSVRGVSRELKDTRDRLNIINRNRTEDAYLYLSSITPPVGSEDIHSHVVGQAETQYVGDSLTIRDLRASVDKYTDTIKMSRASVPSGRRGKNTRAGYLTAPALADLLDSLWFEPRSPGRMEFKFSFKNDLVVESIHYGRPIIYIEMTVDKSNCRDGTNIRRVTGVSADKKAFLHPHLNGTSSWCLGTYIKPLNTALLGGNMPVAASLLWQYLSRFNADSPLIPLESCREGMALARPRDVVIRRK